jgi:hypothetical protein
MSTARKALEWAAQAELAAGAGPCPPGPHEERLRRRRGLLHVRQVLRHMASRRTVLGATDEQPAVE